MASYHELNALIDAYINRNGVQAITGQILNGVLKAMVEQIGRGYAIMGVADPNTDPWTPDAPESWFAYEPGTYTLFDGITVAPGEFVLLCFRPNEGWRKETLYEGFQTVQATIDGNVGTPSVGVSYANGILSFDFRNMKGNPGQDGQDGDPAGFGTIGADITGGVGTPGVTVESSGPATAKDLQFHFTNLKGETGVTSVVVTVDNTSGNPQCAVSLNAGVLTLAFTGLKGAQGDTGSSVDYPFTIVNNLTTDDATQALSAAQGVVLEGEISQLEAEVKEDGFSVSTFDHSTFTQQTPNITLASPLKMEAEGDYIEIKVNANGTDRFILRDGTAAYNHPAVRYTASNTFIVRFSPSVQFSFQDVSKVFWNQVQIIKIVLVSVSGGTYSYDIYLNGEKVGSQTMTATTSWNQIGYNSVMDLYYIKAKLNGTDVEYTKFSEITGAVGITDIYSYKYYDGLVPINEKVDALEAEAVKLDKAVFGEDMYYQFATNIHLYSCEQGFWIYQRIKGNIYAGIALAYYILASDIYPNGYWRIERTNIVSITDGVVTTIKDQAIVAGENEFVLKWLAGAGYNASGGFTGGFHFGEKIAGVTGAWVEFVADGNTIATDADIPLTPCKSFYYRERSAIYNCNDNPPSIAAWHIKETTFKDCGYETINSVEFVQALDYFAYTGIVCVSRWLSEYAMPEGVATITDMGDGEPTQTQQFKSNGHRIHYEGNGYCTDVESEVLFGADDTLCERVVYNSTSYNKFYRRNPDTPGSLSNRMMGRCKVKFSPQV